MYQMTTISSATRIRTEPNTASSVLVSVSANVTVKASEMFTAPVQLRNANGVYQIVGDKWLKVTYNGVTGWMAYVHMGDFICGNFQEITEPAPVSGVSGVSGVSSIPDYFDLIAPDGTKTRYVKA